MKTMSVISYRLSAEHIDVNYGDAIVLQDLNIQFPHGKITAIVGPNACGKSTTLKAMARLLTPDNGTVYLDGKDIHRHPTKETARILGVLPQSPLCPEGIIAYDLISRGRTPHQSAFQRWTQKDEDAVVHAMQLTNTDDLADRSVDSLSGGQRQRVWIAMAIAQQTDILLLDEPTTFLDMPHQVEILKMVRSLNTNGDRTIVAVLHDLNLACRYADHMIAMNNGTIIAQGKPTDIINEKTIMDVFEMPSVIIPDPITKTPMIIPR